MKNIKKFTAGIVMLAISVFMLSYAAFASYDINILINGEEIKTSVEPVIENGNMLIALRDVFEKMGISVAWDEKNRCAYMQKDSNSVRVYPDSGRILKNGIDLDLQSKPRIKNDRIIVPIRAVSESFGYNVLWCADTSAVSITKNSLLKVSFFDCGQADCIFIELPDGKCMLIDSGESLFGEKLKTFINDAGYTHIDYLIATHPHGDHIGSMAYILDNFTVGNFYMPKKSHTTKTFFHMLNALEKNGCECRYLSAGDNIKKGSYGIKVLSPQKKEYIRLNDYSVVIKLVFREISLLFSADAEATAEMDMVRGIFDLSADILKVGHHGSLTSTTQMYLDKVNPSAAVISVGKDNPYGFPGLPLLSMLESRGIKVYRTDVSGNVQMVSDGYVYVIN